MTSQHRTKVGIIDNGKIQQNNRFNYHNELQTFLKFYGLDTIKLDNEKKLFNEFTHPKAKMENNYKLSLIENELISLSKAEPELPKFFGANQEFGEWVYERTKKNSHLRDYFCIELLDGSPLFKMVSGKVFKEAVGDEGYVVVNWDTHKGTYGGSWGTYGLDDINKAIEKVSKEDE